LRGSLGVSGAGGFEGSGGPGQGSAEGTLPSEVQGQSPSGGLEAKHSEADDNIDKRTPITLQVGG